MLTPGDFRDRGVARWIVRRVSDGTHPSPLLAINGDIGHVIIKLIMPRRRYTIRRLRRAGKARRRRASLGNVKRILAGGKIKNAMLAWRARKMKAMVRAVARAEVHHMAQNKKHQEQHGMNIGSDPNLYPTFANDCMIDLRHAYLDNIPIGNDIDARIANTIVLRKFLIKGYFYQPDSSAVQTQFSYPMIVKWRALKDKRQNSISAQTLAGQLATDMYDHGNSTQGPTGTLWDNVAKLNTEKYVWKETSRDYKVGRAQFDLNLGQTSQYQVANNDYKMTERFTINCLPWFPKTLKYNDDEAACMCDKVYLMFTAVRGDGGYMPIADLSSVRAQYSVELEWESF